MRLIREAMLYATGLREQDLTKPQVGIASVWFEGNRSNMHLLALAEQVRQGVVAAGLVGTIPPDGCDVLRLVSTAIRVDANLSLDDGGAGHDRRANLFNPATMCGEDLLAEHEEAH